MSIQQINRKLKFRDFEQVLTSAPRLENITVGQCDFDRQPSVQGRLVGIDAIYVCEHHKARITPEEGPKLKLVTA